MSPQNQGTRKCVSHGLVTTMTLDVENAMTWNTSVGVEETPTTSIRRHIRDTADVW